MTMSHAWEGFLGMLVAARGSSALLPQYVGVRTGLRKSLDDWIPVNRLEQLQGVLASFGLVSRIDCIFTPLPPGKRPIGLQYAPTTRAEGHPWRGGSANVNVDEMVHIVVASKGEWADEALHNAWYPVAIHNRVVRKPLKDHEWLGRAFGYPECCVRAFVDDNDWSKKNIYAEAGRRSRRVAWQTNCFPKLTPWTTVFHMPCAFDCTSTIEYSNSLLEEIGACDRIYRDKIEHVMRQPVLSLSERCGFTLHNSSAITTTTVKYFNVTDWYVGTPYRQTAEIERVRLLNSGDHLEIEDGCVIVERGGSLLGVIEPIWDEDVVEKPEIVCFE